MSGSEDKVKAVGQAVFEGEGHELLIIGVCRKLSSRCL